MNLRFSPVRFKSNSTAAALAVAAAVMLVPANLLPVLSTETSGYNRSDTIFSGTVELWRQGLWVIATIVFTASICIPLFKLAGLGWLLLSVRHGCPHDSRRLTRTFAVVDFVGRWSMLDVFLAAFLTGLVQFGEFSSVQARSGVVGSRPPGVLPALPTLPPPPRFPGPPPAKVPPNPPRPEPPYP